MKLIQFHQPGLGKRVGVVTRDEEIIDVTSEETPDVLQLLQLANNEGISIGVILADVQEEVSQDDVLVFGPDNEGDNDKLKFADLDNHPDPDTLHLLMPLDPPEAWGFGVTYKRSADMRDKDSDQNIYSRVYHAERPEMFFKGTATRCTGPNGAISIRSDSTFTAAEPELAYILGVNGEILGYTICNDVSAWDIERENPLYLPQSKIFTGCCAIGPMFVTPSEVDDPYHLNIKCQIFRNGQLAYQGEVNTSQINWKFETLTEFLRRDNPIPHGTVVSTGTGIITPEDMPLADGDIVEIEIDGLGKLSNPVKQL
ncbi:TPA: 2-keto-3-deoxy-D-arabinonate dehydratase [Candidatus Poribacteria bacterium]|jgi:2-dehydro-3-deoxy-D-arabinonate dehydratase|nr:2-keto-3-deoxy-D-arabinonate dehydratase [Candidatus Poribacteria bacterium]HIB89172.1 2-keto-3-deoxy-D-arabinonate dehydratase [Candidatus Poribacteria bacterium]HIC01392.1 2-keto-3-deoxy-D-arabinonate dehydratase [Candidatus Poribacteria bacterium]HIN31013.1 2-keto-3-deoxy-D-arabinonate dehydratase [Candidatus Poribacteria bacterium]HIO05843.1 2-keto-3-deoxy-D-arabinonate dehydratase [Candidatus Poribacteria bacterium]